MAKWKKMTAGMGVLSVAMTTLVLATEEHYHRDEDEPLVRIGSSNNSARSGS